jgi:hypothetical protein
MFHSNRNDVIEPADDIQEVLGVHVGEENGSKVATLKVILDPRKDWEAVKDFFVHLANGINQPRMFGPFTTPESPADLPAAPAPVAVEPESTETTQPIPVAPASQSEASTSTAEVSTDNSTTADTVQLPSVPDTSKKGK